MPPRWQDGLVQEPASSLASKRPRQALKGIAGTIDIGELMIVSAMFCGGLAMVMGSRTNALRNGFCEKIGDSSHPRGYKPAPWPDEVDVSRVAYEFVKNGDDIRILEIIRKRDFGEPADSYAG